MRGLYIHIPFCKHICSYCDFPKRIAKNDEQIKIYIGFLLKEIERYKEYLDRVKTIFIGGGTPNMLSDELLEELLSSVQKYVKEPLEFTIECNPELITNNQIELFKKYGVNRVSLGVESFIDEDLVKLNRHHTKKKALEVIKMLKEKGITNINIDLIFAHPFDSLEKVKTNLEIFSTLDIPHLSYYSMILEDKTVFKYLYDNNKLELVAEDDAAIMYEYIINYLKKNGYHHYETSNFAKNGFESRHNLLYWQEEEYVGVGAGAAGFLNNIRYTNSYHLDKYYEGCKEEEVLSNEDIKKEYMMLGFRKIDGISISDYLKRFNTNIFDDFKFDKLMKEELIEIKDDFITLTQKGIMLANEVFMEFI